MAKKDAIFDYSSAFDTSSYLSGIGSDWSNNVGNAVNFTNDQNWRGDPSSSIAVRAGWEAGTWKRLDLYNIAFDSSIGGGFASMTHRLLYDIKVAFNLPNQYNLATWQDEYTRDAGEDHVLQMKVGNKPATPMIKADTATGMCLNPSDNNAFKCVLAIPISGYNFHGVNDNTGSWTVWPTSTNISTMNTHYTTLEDNNTASASWTDPTKVGSEFTETGSIILLNGNTYHKPSSTPAQTTDTLLLGIGYTTHTYAQIKALIDAAIA
jgi:hypothetical protein